MGLMRFIVPRRESLADHALERSYCAGMDDIPWQTRVQWADDVLTVRRTEHDSGNFYIPWRVPGRGELLLSTGTLMEREAPYHLSVELARGAINRLRNQTSQWQSVGLLVTESITRQLSQALEHFSRAVTRQVAALYADQEAQAALVVALAASAELGREFAEQSLQARARQGSKLTTLLGVDLGNTLVPDESLALLAGTFNAATVPMAWRSIEPLEGQHDWTVTDRQLEWCRAQGLKVCSGPLLQLDRCSAPDWLYLFEGDDDNLLALAAEHVKTTVTRCRGKVHLWQCAGRMNVSDVFSLSEEQRLRLAVMSVELTRQHDPRAPIVLSIDQPWAEFMGVAECDLSPWHFADVLARAQIGLSGIGLEINLGYWPGGTSIRDVLEFGRMLDRWSMLGLPLLVQLTLPSAPGADPRARGTARPLAYAAGGEPTIESQCDWVERYLPSMLSRQAVQGIFWNQLGDAAPHDYPHGGLFDAEGKPKPALAALRNLRQHFVS